jgi:peroxiredoxin (alkyl hydroperoxide reductase subunit C)
VLPGSAAPAFTLKDQHNQDVSLSDFTGRKAVLLVFYPLAFSGTCQGELTEVKENLGAYANDVVQILTVSVDSTWSHRVWADREGFDFPLLSDFWPHGAVARAYGVFHDDAGFANRGTFLIDRDGVVRFAEMLGPGESRNQDTWRQALAALT